MMGNTRETLNIFYQNVCGLRTKCIEIHNNILCNDYDIILLTETWLQNDVFDTEICDNRYDIFRVDRDLSKAGKESGGGIMLCIKSRLNASISQKFSFVNIYTEMLCVTIPACYLGTNSKLHIVLVYLPPNYKDIPSQLEEIKMFLTCLIDECPDDTYLLIGDFNLRCLDWRDGHYTLVNNLTLEMQNAATEFIDFLTFFGLKQYNFNLNHLGRCLDLVFCNENSSVDRAPSLITKEDRNHPSFLVCLTDLFVTPLLESLEPRRNFHTCDYPAIIDYLNGIDWDDLFTGKTMDDALEIFYKKINGCLDKLVPFSKRVIRDKYKPWYSAALVKIIREKSKMHKRWKRYGNPRDRDVFIMLRKRQQVVHEQCYRNYIAATENSIDKNPKALWSYIKSKRNGSQYPKQFTYQDQTLTEGSNICNKFNEFFHTMFSQGSNTNSVLVRLAMTNVRILLL